MTPSPLNSFLDGKDNTLKTSAHKRNEKSSITNQHIWRSQGTAYTPLSHTHIFKFLYFAIDDDLIHSPTVANPPGFLFFAFPPSLPHTSWAPTRKRNSPTFEFPPFLHNVKFLYMQCSGLDFHSKPVKRSFLRNSMAIHIESLQLQVIRLRKSITVDKFHDFSQHHRSQFFVFPQFPDERFPRISWGSVFNASFENFAPIIKVNMNFHLFFFSFFFYRTFTDRSSSLSISSP